MRLSRGCGVKAKSCLTSRHVVTRRNYYFSSWREFEPSRLVSLEDFWELMWAGQKSRRRECVFCVLYIGGILVIYLGCVSFHWEHPTYKPAFKRLHRPRTRFSNYSYPLLSKMHIQPPTATFPSSSSASTTSPSSTILQNLHILSLDGTGATTLPFMYKDMTVDRLKRSITATLRKPAYMWEELSLYCLGVVMKNGEFPWGWGDGMRFWLWEDRAEIGCVWVIWCEFPSLFDYEGEGWRRWKGGERMKTDEMHREQLSDTHLTTAKDSAVVDKHQRLHFRTNFGTLSPVVKCRFMKRNWGLFWAWIRSRVGCYCKWMG